MVLDRLCQKLANSGYDLAMTRKGLVAGLKGYENRLSQSRRDPGSSGYRALHESAGVSFGARCLKKLTGKSTWFKKKNNKDHGNTHDDHEERSQRMSAPTLQEHRRAERIQKREILRGRARRGHRLMLLLLV